MKRFLPASLLSASVAACFLLGSPGVARADVKHTIARGHTLEAIANRYHVTVRAILETNHLRNARHLRVGDVLTIPTAAQPPGASGANARQVAKTKTAHGLAGARTQPAARAGWGARPKTPGVAHLSRVATKEELTLRIRDRRRRQSPTAAKQIEHLMRSPVNGAKHAIDPRLVALLGVVSDHFGSRKLQVISGFRPYAPSQSTLHSNHNHGRAIDFRVVGVPNEAVRDFCRTLHNTGCGYYPNSVFVHMDVRATPAYWVDHSKPGEPPRYHAPSAEADEGVSDVHAESKIEGGSEVDAAPTEAPARPAEPAGPSPEAPPPAAPPPATPPSAPTAPAAEAKGE